MRIALIVPGYAADHDWGIPVLRTLVRGLADRHEVSLFALRYPHRAGCDIVDGVRVRALGGASARGFATARLLIRAATRVVADLRPRPPALLHALWADEPGAVAIAAARVLRVPAIASVLGGEPVALPAIGYGGRLGRLNRRLFGCTLRHAARITVPSAYVRGSIEPHVPPDRIVDLPLGIDPARFHPDPRSRDDSPIDRGQPRLLNVGALVPVKDQTTLLEAFALVRDRLPEAHLHIIGEGPLRHELERRTAGLGLAGHVTLHGWIDHECMPAWYRAADLYVQSSRYESQGMAVLEAAACGLPIVGTAVGLLPELPGVTVLPVGDAAALAAGIIRRASEGVHADHRPLAGRILERYTMEHTLDRLGEVYEVGSGRGTT